jgi:hypothetical protein
MPVAAINERMQCRKAGKKAGIPDWLTRRVLGEVVVSAAVTPRSKAREFFLLLQGMAAGLDPDRLGEGVDPEATQKARAALDKRITGELDFVIVHLVALWPAHRGDVALLLAACALGVSEGDVLGKNIRFGVRRLPPAARQEEGR